MDIQTIFTQIVENQYLQSAIILGLFLIFSFFAYFVVKQILKFVLRQQKIDPELLKRMKTPSYFLVLFLGLYFAVQRLPLGEIGDLWISRIAFALFILIFTYFTTRIVSVLISNWLKVQKHVDKTPVIFNKLISITLYLIAILLILNHFNVEVSPLLATLGVGALAIGLALQNTLANFFAGIHLISDKLIKVGDYIELDQTTAGYIEDISWRSTKIRTRQKTAYIIPNAKLVDSVILNDSNTKGIEFTIACGVSYNSNLQKVEDVTLDVARSIQKTVKGAVKEFVATVRYINFGDSNIDFTTTLKAETVEDQIVMKHEFIKALKERFDKEKIEISYPVRKVYTGR